MSVTDIDFGQFICNEWLFTIKNSSPEEEPVKIHGEKNKDLQKIPTDKESCVFYEAILVLW